MPRVRAPLLALACLALATASLPAASAGGEAAGDAIRYVFVVPLSHLDIGFTGTPREVAALQKRYLDEAIEHAENDPRFRWAIESVYQYDQWAARTDDPAQVERLRALVAADRIELTAGYVGAHQGQWGAEEANRFPYPGLAAATDLGTSVRTAIVDDVPGSSWALPQVLAGNGVSNLVAGINTTFGGEPDIPMADSLFTWRGVDGSEVLTWVSRRSYAEGIFDWCLGCAYDDMERLTGRRIGEYEDAGYPYDSVIALHGFDNEGPDLIVGALDNIERWNREHASPKLVVSTPTAFFDHVREVHGDDAFAAYAGDWSGRWETNDAYTPVSTALVRGAKSHAPAAETLGSVARLYGAEGDPAPIGALDGVYRGLHLFDEHSGAGGGSPDLTVEQVREGNRWWARHAVRTAAGAERLLREALAALAEGIAADRRALAVVNPSSWARTDLVRVARGDVPAAWLRGGTPTLVDLATGEPVPTQLVEGGRTLLFRADGVPPVGYKLFAPVAGSPAAASVAGPGSVIGNAFYRLEVDPVTGRVTSLWDRTASRELVDRGSDFRFGEAVASFQNGAFVYGTYRHVEAAGAEVSVRRGPVARVLTVRREGSPHARTEWWLYDGVPRVDVVNVLDRARMPFVPHERHTRWYFLAYPFDLGPGVDGHFQGPNGFPVPQRDWIPGTRHGARVSRTATDLRGGDGFGVTVANRETYLSAFGGIGFWTEATPSEAVLLPVPAAKTDEILTADAGWARFRTLEPGLPTVYRSALSLTSSDGGFDPVAVSAFGAGFATDLLPVVVAPNPAGVLPAPSASLISLDRATVALTTLKGAEDGSGDLILRVQEVAGEPATGVTLTAGVAFASAELNGLGEQRDAAVALPVDPVRFDIGAHQTLTIRLRPAA